MSRPDGAAEPRRDQETCAGIRSRLLDSVIGAPASGFKSESLDPEIRAHLDACDECSAFRDELLCIQKTAEQARMAAESTLGERAKSSSAMQTIWSAIDEGLERREALPRRKGSLLVENLAFLTFALAVLFAQAMVLLRLKPAVVIGLEAGLNWLAPFIFYVIFRLDRRPARRGGEGLR